MHTWVVRILLSSLPETRPHIGVLVDLCRQPGKVDEAILYAELLGYLARMCFCWREETGQYL